MPCSYQCICIIIKVKWYELSKLFCLTKRLLYALAEASRREGGSIIFTIQIGLLYINLIAMKKTDRDHPIKQ
jgi:hypothetical protein